ncbi:glycosyltransferase [Halobacteriovorax sp. ZH5_bin.2]|uniref:glycosyltransferase n=1 Tax=Halobacteriovorax sp. ZH5_bin.2 TaxID=3157727 RepID=UPI00370F941A
MKKRTLYYFTPSNINESDASAVRAYHNTEGLKKFFDIEVSYATNNENLFFNLPSNKDSLIKRLVLEILVGLELVVRKFIFKKYDFYILSSPSFVTVVIQALFLGLTKKQYFLDVRDIYPEVFFHLGIVKENSLLGRILKKITRRVYLKAQGVVTVTNGLLEIINDYKTNTPSKVIYNGFDLELFKNSRKSSQFTVIFHGNMSKMQNIDLLLEISNQLPDDIKLIVIGDGPQSFKVKAQKNINYLGKLAHKNLVRYVNSSHVGLSLRNDGLVNSTALPVKVFEYIGAGLNIISTPISEVGTVFKEYNGIFEFSNNDVDKIVKKVIELKKLNFQKTYYEVPLQFSRQNQSAIFCEFVLKTIEMKI